MLYADVFGNRVTAPRAATECQRRSKFEVVKVAYTALRRGSIYENTAGLHCLAEYFELLLSRGYVEINGRSVAIATVCNQPFSLSNGIFKACRPVHCKYGGKLFVSELLGELDRFDFADENLCRFRYFYACKRGNLECALSDYLRVERTVNYNRLSYFVKFLSLEEIATSVSKLLLYLVIDLICDDDGLLGSANHAVIEGLAVDYGVYRKENVGTLVYNCGSVACAYAEGGLAARISGLNHAGTAGCENRIDAGHEHGSHVERGNIYPADYAFGSTCFDSSLVHYFCSSNRRPLSSGVRAYNTAVSGL